VAVTPAGVTSAQEFYNSPAYPLMYADDASSTAVATDDTDVSFIVKYVGEAGTGYTSSTTTMDVNANDITFLLSGAAVTDFECPVSGAYGGVIDLTNAACDTLGEIEDIINTYGYDDGWRIVLINGKRADSSASLLDAAAAVVADADGAPAYQDTTTEFESQRAVLTTAQQDINYYLGDGPDFYYKPNPFKDTRPVLLKVQWLTTYASGTSGLYVTEQDYKWTDIGGTPSVSTGTEKATFYQISGATTVSASTSLPTYGIPGDWGRKMFVRIVNSAAMSVRTQVTTGLMLYRGGAHGGVEYR
jgi:hypothetical protein